MSDGVSKFELTGWESVGEKSDGPVVPPVGESVSEERRRQQVGRTEEPPPDPKELVAGIKRSNYQEVRKPLTEAEMRSAEGRRLQFMAALGNNPTEEEAEALETAEAAYGRIIAASKLPDANSVRDINSSLQELRELRQKLHIFDMSARLGYLQAVEGGSVQERAGIPMTNEEREELRDLERKIAELTQEKEAGGQKLREGKKEKQSGGAGGLFERDYREIQGRIGEIEGKLRENPGDRNLKLELRQALGEASYFEQAKTLRGLFEMGEIGEDEYKKRVASVEEELLRWRELARKPEEVISSLEARVKELEEQLRSGKGGHDEIESLRDYLGHYQKYASLILAYLAGEIDLDDENLGRAVHRITEGVAGEGERLGVPARQESLVLRGRSRPAERVVDVEADLEERYGQVKDEIDKWRGEAGVVPTGLLTEFESLQSKLLAIRGSTGVEAERDAWVGYEYRQRLYTRLQPGFEPRFWKQADSEQQELWEARWQLARAVWWKQNYSSEAEKQLDNPDVGGINAAALERMYRMEGVRPAMEWYVREILRGRTKIAVTRGVGDRMKTEEVSILDCRNEIEFEMFREKMRSSVLGEIGERAAKEADAVAWNLTYISGLVESIDSRYSFARGRHKELTEMLCSDDLRSLMHPQEKAESKWIAGVLEWSRFGDWGVAQMKRVRRKYRVERGDEIVMLPARGLKEYWKVDRVVRQRGGKERSIYLRVPECHPTTVCGSFFEESRVGGKNVLELLDQGEEINWAEVENSFGNWVNVTLRQGLKVGEYFRKGVPYKKTEEDDWARKLMDGLLRTGMARRFEGDKRGYHNLKVWAWMASLGGVKNPKKAWPTSRMGHWDRGLEEYTLQLPKVGFLERRRWLVLPAEDLKLKSPGFLDFLKNILRV